MVIFDIKIKIIVVMTVIFVMVVYSIHRYGCNINIDLLDIMIINASMHIMFILVVIATTAVMAMMSVSVNLLFP